MKAKPPNHAPRRTRSLCSPCLRMPLRAGSLSFSVRPPPHVMPAERERMIATLKMHVVPVLKARGFKGSFPHFRRPTDTAMHLLTFQFDKRGGGFVVEIASCPTEGVTMHWGKHIPPARITAHDIAHRLRLGSPDSKSDHWFKYDRRGLLSSGDPYERAAQEVLPLLDSQAETFWRQTDTQTPST
jgi:hypothetical protein